MARTTRVVIVTALAIALSAPPAPAFDHETPEATLAAKGKTQRGKLVSAAWVALVDPDSGACGKFGEFAFGRPRAIRVRARKPRITITFHKAHAPTAVEVHWSRKLAGSPGRPLANPKHKAVTVTPTVLPDGSPGHAVSFRHRLGKGLFIDIRGEWTDQEECPEAHQAATWTFSVRPKRR